MLRTLLSRGHGAPARLQQPLNSAGASGFHSRAIIARSQGQAASGSTAKPDIRELAKMAQIGVTDKEVRLN